MRVDALEEAWDALLDLLARVFQGLLQLVDAGDRVELICSIISPPNSLRSALVRGASWATIVATSCSSRGVVPRKISSDSASSAFRWLAVAAVTLPATASPT